MPTTEKQEPEAQFRLDGPGEWKDAEQRWRGGGRHEEVRDEGPALGDDLHDEVQMPREGEKSLPVAGGGDEEMVEQERDAVQPVGWKGSPEPDGIESNWIVEKTKTGMTTGTTSRNVEGSSVSKWPKAVRRANG